MAGARLCSIEGCGKIAGTRGWCEAHYRRWRRHGDPLGGHASRGDLGKFFNEVVLPYDGEECLYWPYSGNRGYGTIVIDGRHCYVHRLVCEAANGEPPTPDHEAAHSCGNGHLGCCAKRHLSWKTHAENAADMHIHGTVLKGDGHPVSKLTEAQAREIVALKGKVSQSKLAKRFGVCPSNIGSIQNGRTWRT